jgi:hypothetical protein
MSGYRTDGLSSNAQLHRISCGPVSMWGLRSQRLLDEQHTWEIREQNKFAMFKVKMKAK